MREEDEITERLKVIQAQLPKLPAEAEGYYRRGLAIREACLGPIHASIAASLFHLAVRHSLAFTMQWQAIGHALARIQYVQALLLRFFQFRAIHYPTSSVYARAIVIALRL
jgi:hypothetical protein